jgi:hypothetical protein
MRVRRAPTVSAPPLNCGVRRHMASESAIVRSFSRAASELGFCFTPSFTQSLPDGSILHALGLVHQFGATRGMLLYADHVPLPPPAILRSLGLSYSVLGAGYEQFERDLFVSTLNDWQFFGESKPPWYTGKPWA